MSRSLTPPAPSTGVSAVRTQFYKEEFLKYQRCLDQQREYFSARTIGDVEAALTRVIAHLECLCRQDDADRVVSALLKQLDVVTGLSAGPGSQKFH